MKPSGRLGAVAGEVKIIDALSYFATLQVVRNPIVSLPPQMARYLKDVFGPRARR